ncbi:MAG: 3-phosphoserine/phosphohydroxythreonine transaminase [Christensenellaceae bacterium]|jgi:phosphoserine aminotransferase|nr:3-phosphoserine/phosphohydroxythreonine transaminase [Christensenellaceae bacterium]
MAVFNFSAGPSMLADEVKLEAQREFLNCVNSGMSITEMSHRSKPYEKIHNESISLLRELMNIGDEFEVLLLQGGASQQFDAIPLNLLVNKGRADYIITGNFASKAFQEAQKFGDVSIAASSKDRNFAYIPNVDSINFRSDLDYIHFTYNNTIFGTKFTNLPKTSTTLVSDISSIILSENIEVNKFGLLYAGAQKNIGPSGLTVVIVRKDLIGTCLPICPTMLKYSVQTENNSLYNTPPCFSIYMATLTFRWIKKLGGVDAINKINKYKAGLLYDFIDNSKFYKNPVDIADRSLMNVPFTTPSAELDAQFVKGAESLGLLSLKGHRSVGGMRASIYNAMPIEGVKTLISYMEKFELSQK